MILESILESLNRKPGEQPAKPTGHYIEPLGYARQTDAGQPVSAESSKNVATIYRAANIISDDVAKLPFQQLISKKDGQIERVKPDFLLRNAAYLNEVAPNRFMTPFVFKKAVILWMFFWGNAYIWSPPVLPRERFILPANVTTPVFDAETGELWYETRFPNDPYKPQYLPAVEVLHLMMNSSDGYTGRSMITYARETIGRRLAQAQTMSKRQGNGLTPDIVAQVDGDSTKEIREKIREQYQESFGGSKNAGGLVIFDRKFTKIEPITMKSTDMEFLNSIEATDADLANFANIPLHKLNKGKQTYESNIQQQLDYLSTTLDPYLVQYEQGAGLNWLRSDEQPYSYFRHERNALLRMTPKERADYLSTLVQNGMLKPNEGRQIDDRSASDDPNADKLYMNGAVQPLDALNRGANNANQA